MAVSQLLTAFIMVGALRASEGRRLEGPHIAPMTLDAACDITCDRLSKPVQHVNTYYDNTDRAHYQGHPEDLNNQLIADYDLDDCSVECVLTPKFDEEPLSTSQSPTTVTFVITTAEPASTVPETLNPAQTTFSSMPQEALSVSTTLTTEPTQTETSPVPTTQTTEPTQPQTSPVPTTQTTEPTETKASPVPITQTTEPTETKTSPLPTTQTTEPTQPQTSPLPTTQTTEPTEPKTTLKGTTQPLQEYLPTHPGTTDWY